MVHLLFGPEVRYMLQENETDDMKAFLETLHPATVAEALAGDLTVDQVWKFLENTSIRNQAAIFEYFPIEWQVKLVEGTGRERMAHLIEQMSHDDRVDLLRRLMPRVAESLMRLVDEADRRDIATLYRQNPTTAGGVMTTDYAWLPPNITATEALDRMRLQAPSTETIYYIFVLDEQHRLVGVLSLRDLILAPRHAVIKDLMEDRIVSVRVNEDREKAAVELARYDLLALPVVDDQNRMVGIITHDDVIDVVVQEATEDAHRMGAVAPLAENYMKAKFVTVWRKRAFWLACLFLAELFTFTALAHFEDAINQMVVLSLFVPLVISTGGNSGSQAATLITRAMALGQVQLKDWFRVFRHELVLGLALGGTLGVIGFVRASFTPEDVRSSSPPRNESFEVVLPAGATPLKVENHMVDIPAGARQELKSEGISRVRLPEGKELGAPVERDGTLVYEFPKDCTMPRPPVALWRLALVIGQAVASICVWGTLVGSMLPLIFKRLGVDPGIASSPFVATFVDVTGIMIYFTIASIWLLAPLT
ncbi:MAG: magnesium transporter [Planctomycetes bacterium]|nr:magnesium transporter [Planctomycetota bacterium]